MPGLLFLPARNRDNLPVKNTGKGLRIFYTVVEEGHNFFSATLRSLSEGLLWSVKLRISVQRTPLER